MRATRAPPVLGGEDGALARRPQAPLEVVEKFLTNFARKVVCWLG